MHSPISPAVQWLHVNCGDKEEAQRFTLSEELQVRLSVLQSKVFAYTETFRIPSEHVLTYLKLKDSGAPAEVLAYVLNEAAKNVHADFTAQLRQYSIFDQQA